MRPEAVTVPRGTLVLETIPNPLRARLLPDGEFEVKFVLVMREEGGVRTRIEDFTVEAVALGGVIVRSEHHSASAITARGYPVDVDAGKYMQFEFSKRWKLPSGILLAGSSVRVTARTVDANGRRNVTNFRAAVDLLH